ncbi:MULTISPECIES: hypothetical protein [Enterococcus]|uniref:hypothetical protein n=1 Tax=Enterococcus TaxID=1350 RepID=UPI0007753443|nr:MULTISPECIES: hypothetical protein [Enterococcus]KXS07776.1 hypothetical protein AUC59_06435 [Enterococcus faecium]MCM6878409.1 hypothetical protein [Enterococcus faecium]STQ48380.1 Uncharacterised protein [Enterococcus durans]
MNIKSNLTPFSTAKLSEVTIANVAHESSGLILSAKKAPRYNGEEEIRGSVAKIKCEFINADLAKILEKSGADVHQLKTNTLEIVGNENDLINITEDELINTILPLNKAKVMLKWVSNRSSSGWKGLKLVVDLNDLHEGEK